MKMRWIGLVVALLGAWGSQARAATPTPERLAARLGWEIGVVVMGRMAGDEKMVAKSYDDAKVFATALGCTLPALPAAVAGEPAKNGAAALGFALTDATKACLPTLKANGTAPLYEVSLKLGILAVLYAPGDKTGLAAAAAVEKAAAKANLPEKIWKDVVAQVRAGGSVKDVRTLVLTARKEIDTHLAQAK